MWRERVYDISGDNSTQTEIIEYEYNSFGDITKISQWNWGWDNAKIMEFDYDYYDPDTLTDNPLSATFTKETTVKNVSGLYENSNKVTSDITTRETFDFYGNKIREIDGNNNAVSYYYYIFGRHIKTVYPDSSTEEYIYDDIDNTITFKINSIDKACYGFNEIGNLCYLSIYLNGEHTLFENMYDSQSRLSAQVEYTQYGEEAGNYTEYEYYSYGKPKSIRITEDSPDGNLIKGESYTYSMENVPDVGVCEKTTILREGDETITPAAEYYYTNDMGFKVLEATEVNEHTGGGVYQPQIYNTVYEHDLLGNVISVTDPRGMTITKEYDYKGRLIKETYPYGSGTKSTEYLYDPLGRLIQTTDFAGNYTWYEYNNADMLTSVVTPMDEEYAETKNYYDINGNNVLTEVGITYGDSFAWQETRDTYTEYDSMNRPVKTKVYDGEKYNIVRNIYDINGNLSQRHTGVTEDAQDTEGENCSVYSYEYDNLNRLTKATDPLGQDTQYAYGIRGELIQTIDKMDNMVDYEYSRANLLTNKTAGNDETEESVEYTYDIMGNCTGMIDDTGTTTYKYDNLGRLTEVFEPGNIIKRYVYDKGGNRTGFALCKNGETEINLTYAYNSLNQLTSVTGAEQTQSIPMI